ncbi:Non-heme chloroperoxidase [Perkinsela sp. CCAP 1560/4]|nr:Non-heme chloroperoxidase [Perkinsela sp. CCAP 1560/4]|eukprot:KNH09592.1 Non-heme chloroperoxidase [Perkinsela sp. CCAP 1560/4]
MLRQTFIRVIDHKVSLNVVRLPGILSKFGVCVEKNHETKGKETHLIPIIGSLPGDIVYVTSTGRLDSQQVLDHIETGQYHVQRISKYRIGRTATKCPLSDITCRRCPWREMSSESQLRLKILIMGEFLFSELKIRREDVTENFNIANTDMPEMVDQLLHFHTLYFGTGMSLKNRRVGTIYQASGTTTPFIRSIHTGCKIMSPEVREIVSGVNDWWARCNNKLGWDSGKDNKLSKLLSITIHHLSNRNDIMVRIHAIGNGPNDYSLCTGPINLDQSLSESESTMIESIKNRLLSVGYTGKLHLGVLMKNPVNGMRFLKMFTGEDVAIDHLRISGVEILVPIRMAGTTIVYDRHPIQHGVLCEEIRKRMLLYRHRNLLIVNEREKLDCTALSTALFLCKTMPELVHVVYPVLFQVKPQDHDTSSLKSRKSEFTLPFKEKTLLDSTTRLNNVPDGVLRENLDEAQSIDISIICYTDKLFKEALDGRSHHIMARIRESQFVYIICPNFLETLEIRRGLDYLIHSNFRVSCVRTTSKFHSTQVGGFIELQRI